MKVLYISQTDIDLNRYSIYSDLSNALLQQGHEVTIVCANSDIKKTTITKNGKCTILKIKIPNQFGVNLIKKALILLSFERKFIKNIKKYLSDYEFDLITYTTPPITFCGVIKFCKKKYGCKSYLMLKDIFPQNAVDLGMMKKTGLKGFIYKFFRKKEIKLYNVSDKIGCMSPMNMSYLLENNKYISSDKVEYFPNSAIIKSFESVKNADVLKKYGIDQNKIKIIYGGNLGKPQGLDFLIESLKASENIDDVQFIIIGKGSEKEKVYSQIRNIKNVVALDYIPPKQYDELCKCCDVGLVLLDHRFTIPNYPSRMLSYMANALPMMACVDRNNDVPELLESAKCGKSCYSENIEDFIDLVKWLVSNKNTLKQMGNNGRKYYEENFNVIKYIENFERLTKEKIND